MEDSAGIARHGGISRREIVQNFVNGNKIEFRNDDLKASYIIVEPKLSNSTTSPIDIDISIYTSPGALVIYAPPYIRVDRLWYATRLISNSRILSSNRPILSSRFAISTPMKRFLAIISLYFLFNSPYSSKRISYSSF